MAPTTDADPKAPDAPILITGLPRCGSSWVGQCVARLPNVRYRYESFNADWVPALKGKLAPLQYQPPGTEGPPRIRYAADRAFAGRQSAKQYLRGLYRGYAAPTIRRRGTLVLKDPTACLLAGWLAERENCRIVVLTRHPCGFVHSVRLLGWPMPLERLLRQKRLLRDHLSSHSDCLVASLSDPLAALGALWAATHLVLKRQSETTASPWSFVSYEQLCLEPENGFLRLSEALGLTVKAPEPAATHRDDPGSTRKDGMRVANAWREALTEQEIQRVMAPVRTLGLEAMVEMAPDQPGP
ncbi:MAG: sulfotransferase [Pseudomonadota bacterium]